MANPDRFNLLLAHNPKYFAEYAAWGADIILPGHIHGGDQARHSGRAFLSHITLPEYDAGLYSHGASWMYVTRGLATRHLFAFSIVGSGGIVEPPAIELWKCPGIGQVYFTHPTRAHRTEISINALFLQQRHLNSW